MLASIKIKTIHKINENPPPPTDGIEHRSMSDRFFEKSVCYEEENLWFRKNSKSKCN